jgi:hypothetical protein
MAVQIGVGRKDRSSLRPLLDEPCIELDDDGCYWFLQPFFASILCNETGQYIDLYGDASYEGKHLQTLRSLLAEVRAVVLAQPPTWDVHRGTQVKPTYKEVRAVVERERVLSLLDAWERIIDRAEQLKRRVVCFGD